MVGVHIQLEIFKVEMQPTNNFRPDLTVMTPSFFILPSYVTHQLLLWKIERVLASQKKNYYLFSFMFCRSNMYYTHEE